MRWFQDANRKWPAIYSGTGRVALVTGSTGGIGFYVAKLLASCGYVLIIPARPGLEVEARDTEEAIIAAVPGANVSIPTVPMDLRSFQSVRDFSAEVRKMHSCIDVLCLNAGRGGASTDPREVTPDGWEAIMQVNTTSHFLLVAELFPLLQASQEARIVTQSSGARGNADPREVHDLDGTDPASWNAWSQYSLSKACMCTIALALNDRLRAKGISNIIALTSEPGLTSTGVNIQHDLAKTLGLTRNFKNTNEFHDRAAHHAADGALAMALASLEGAENDLIVGNGRNARSLAEAAVRIRPGRDDPMSWPKKVNDLFWEKATEMTGAEWLI